LAGGYGGEMPGQNKRKFTGVISHPANRKIKRLSIAMNAGSALKWVITSAGFAERFYAGLTSNWGLSFPFVRTIIPHKVLVPGGWFGAISFSGIGRETR